MDANAEYVAMCRKIIADSLVRAGIIKGDDSKHLHWGNVTLTVQKEDAPKTIITLTEEIQEGGLNV